MLERRLQKLERTISIFDPLGLSLFCVTGATTALVHGIAPLPAAILGMITGIGGGVLRDLLLGETPPVVLRRGLYAVPALIGAAVVAVAYDQGFREGVFAIAGAVVCFAIWMVGDRFDVERPTPRRHGDRWGATTTADSATSTVRWAGPTDQGSPSPNSMRRNCSSESSSSGLPVAS